MNERLIKETRDLLPMFIGGLLLIAAPYLFWGAKAADFGVATLGLACAVLGGCSFGNEFQHRTFPLLLSQPISRSVLWRDKMLVLGAAIVMSLAVLLVCQAMFCPVPGLDNMVILVLIALCAFCGAPYWTLQSRQVIVGITSAAGVPASLMAAYALAYYLVFPYKAIEMSSPIILIILISLYCAVVYTRGYAEFKRLEVFDSVERELSLPASLEAAIGRPLAKVTSRFRGPFSSLLKKEFHLQQASFMLAGTSVLFAVAGACLFKLHRETAIGMVGCGFGLDLVILPLVAGAISVAEEKGWDLAEWHLTLPPSAFRQWSAKTVATLSTSLVLGAMLPGLMFLAGQAFFAEPGPRSSLPAAHLILGWMLGSLLLTSVAVYAGSFSKSTLRAILAAVGIVIGSLGVSVLAANGATHSVPPLVLVALFRGGHYVVPILYVSLFLLLCFTQWFAWLNFRRSGVPGRSVAIQLLILLCAAGLGSLTLYTAIHLGSV